MTMRRWARAETFGDFRISINTTYAPAAKAPKSNPTERRATADMADKYPGALATWLVNGLCWRCRCPHQCVYVAHSTSKLPASLLTILREHHSLICHHEKGRNHEDFGIHRYLFGRGVTGERDRRMGGASLVKLFAGYL